MIILKRCKSKPLLMILVVLSIAVLSACGSDENSTDTNSEAETEDKDISIGLDPYDYATVPAYLSQVILEEEGYDVEIEEAEVGILYQALASEDIDAFIDVWRPNLHESYIKEYDDSFVTAGTIFSDMPLGIAVPTYMEDINTIEDLVENADLFDNNIYSIEPGSGMALTTEEMVETYDMDDFDIQNSSVAAMLSQVKKSTGKKEPIAFNAWRPHPMFVNFDIKFLDDPRDSWKLDDIEIGATEDLEEDSPTANKLFSNMDLNIDMVEEWLIEMDEGKEPRELAEEWVEDNQDTVDEWLEK